MKKFNLLIAALLLLSVSIFAVDVDVKATISGNAAVAFGIDLDTNATGFVNTNTAKLTLTFIAKQSESKGADPITGFITLEAADMKFDSGADVVVSGVSVTAAQIKFTPDVHLNILGIAKTVNFAAHGAGVGPGVTIATAAAGDISETVTHGDDSKGVELVVKLPEVATINVGVGSGDIWSANVDNDYTFYAGVAVTALKEAGVDLSFGLNFETVDSSLGLGAKVGLDFSPVKVGVALDYNDAGALQLAAGFAFALGEGKSADTGLFGREYAEGISVGFNTVDFDAMDVSVAFFMGSLPVDLLVYAALVDLTGTLAYGVGVDVRGTFDNLTPYLTVSHLQDTFVKVRTGVTVANLADINGAADAATLSLGVIYDNFTAFDGAADELGVKVGFNKFIPITNLELEYKTADLGNVNGTVTFTTTVSF